ncbi:MAG: chaperone modulator CbpM [Alphaproteobacteria bacterium]|nr:chaperone modulator CbpM [Alphaproteobacteria bacterium]
MKTLTEVIITVGRIEQAELMRWVDLGWIAPSRSPKAEPEFLFSDVDEARIHMICDLRQNMMVEEDTMPLVLSLLDQMYALRHQMNALTSAIQEQPGEVRDAILKQLKATSSRNQDVG